MNELEFVSKVATNLAEDAVTSAWGKIKKYFKDIDAQDEIRYGTAYEEYLRNTKNKYSKVKTLIYRHSPRDIYSFYESIGLKFKGKTIDTADISNLLKVSTKTIITGTGGIGKSMLLKHLFLNAIETTELIPVLIELRSFNTYENKEISLKNMIYNNLKQHGFYLEEEYFDYSIKEGGYIILLDGFDEISREKMPILTEQIREFCNKYPENDYIVSSRPSDEFIGWHDFIEMRSLSLTKEQALSLINKIDFDTTAKEKFYKELDETLYEKYKSFASNPLLLTIMLLTFTDNAYMPESLNDFYDQAFSTLFNMHDATKESYVRDIRSKIGCEDFKLIFSHICFKSYFRNQYDFSESEIREYILDAKKKFDTISFSIDDFLEDLTLSVCMLVKDGLKYTFSHRSFQEYFAALYTCKLTDDVQTKLLSNWLRESPSARIDLYFTMLFNMQSEKVNRIILVPGLKKIEQLYKKKGFTIEFLSDFFMSELRTNKTSNNHYYLSLIVKDMYKCNILTLTCSLNQYNYTQNAYAEQEKILAKELYKEKNKPIRFTFDEVIEKFGQERVLSALKGFENQFLFCMDILKKYQNNLANNKRKVLSIIDEL